MNHLYLFLKKLQIKFMAFDQNNMADFPKLSNCVENEVNLNETH